MCEGVCVVVVVACGDIVLFLEQCFSSVLFARFKKSSDRKEYIEAMQVLLPVLYQRTMAILSDHSVPSVSLQHHILKIFYASMQVGRYGNMASPLTSLRMFYYYYYYLFVAYLLLFLEE